MGEVSASPAEADARTDARAVQGVRTLSAAHERPWPHHVLTHPMPRVDAIWNHPIYQRELQAIERLERGRAYCRHGLSHLLDVARLAWIINLEQGLGLDRELVYAAALLHDIGRARQCEQGIPHDQAGEALTREILGTVEEGQRFGADEQETILGAVRGHRSRSDGDDAPELGTPAPTALAFVLRVADKASRPCYACPARHTCNWPDGKKNLRIGW